MNNTINQWLSKDSNAVRNKTMVSGEEADFTFVCFLFQNKQLVLQRALSRVGIQDVTVSFRFASLQ